MLNIRYFSRRFHHKPFHLNWNIFLGSQPQYYYIYTQLSYPLLIKYAYFGMNTDAHRRHLFFCNSQNILWLNNVFPKIVMFSWSPVSLRFLSKIRIAQTATWCFWICLGQEPHVFELRLTGRGGGGGGGGGGDIWDTFSCSMYNTYGYLMFSSQPNISQEESHAWI